MASSRFPSGWKGGWTLLLTALFLSACAPRTPQRSVLTVEELLKDGAEAGLDRGNPFELDDAIRAQVEREVGFGGTPVERIRRIVRFLNDRVSLHFQYQSNVSLTAVEAFHQRKGDCLSYTNLFLGIARHLKIPAYFVHVSEARNYYERGGIFFVSTHMAVGYGGGSIGQGGSPYTVIVDFTEEASDWRLYLYQAVDDATAVALFYNNIAVDRMLEGRVEEAERMVRYLLSRRPAMKELYNNLSVLLMRQGRYGEALQILEEAMGRFPAYQPLYTNAVQAARGAGRPDLAQVFLDRGRKVAEEDPFFLFNEGVNAFREGRLEFAEERFRKALKKQPNNPFLYAWLSRVLLQAGRKAEGVEAFRKAEELAPGHPLLRSLKDDFPVLATLRPLSPEPAPPPP